VNGTMILSLLFEDEEIAFSKVRGCGGHDRVRWRG